MRTWHPRLAVVIASHKHRAARNPPPEPLHRVSLATSSHWRTANDDSWMLDRVVMFLSPRSCQAARSATGVLQRVGSRALGAQVGACAVDVASGGAAYSGFARNVCSTREVRASARCSQLPPWRRREGWGGKRCTSQQRRDLNVGVGGQPIVGVDPGINVQNEDAWPEWRKKAVNVCILTPLRPMTAIPLLETNKFVLTLSSLKSPL